MDTTKYIQAQAYVAADRAWWSSLTRPLFNEGKDAAHDALNTTRHQDFLTFGAGIAVAKELVARNEENAQHKIRLERIGQ